MIMIIPSAATVATTEVDEVGNILFLCSMLSRMAVLQFPQRILLRTDGMIVLLASSALLLQRRRQKKTRKKGERKEGSRER
jgi:hypothetical protein